MIDHNHVLVVILAAAAALCFLAAIALPLISRRSPGQTVYCSRCGTPMQVAARIADRSSWRCADWQRCAVQARATLPPV